MNKLLRSEYRRLFKTNLFRILSAAACGFGMILSGYMLWMHSQFEDEFHVDDNYFIYATLSGIISAVFISLFVGKLYSDGTMRNMIIMGHSRVKIYLCELAVTLTAQTIFFLSYLVGITVIAYPVFRDFTNSPKTLLMNFLFTVGIMATYTAICLLISILNKNKAAAAIILLLTAFGLMVFSMIVESSLNEPEYYEEYYEYDTDINDMVKHDSMPNPNYISGTKREVYEFLANFLPSGQSFRLGGNYGNTVTTNVFLAYDFCIIVLLSGVGMILYKRKDLN